MAFHQHQRAESQPPLIHVYSHKELGTTLDDNVDQFGQLSLRVIIVCLSCTFSDFWQEKIDTKGSILVLEAILQVGNLLLEKFGSVSDTANDSESACISNGGGEFGTCLKERKRKIKKSVKVVVKALETAFVFH